MRARFFARSSILLILFSVPRAPAQQPRSGASPKALQPFASDSELSAYLARIWPAEVSCSSGNVLDTTAVRIPATDSIGQRFAVVRGRVTSAAGSPLNGVQVWSTESGVGVQTNSDGRYSLSIPADRLAARDSVTISARLIGYSEAHRVLKLRLGMMRALDISLCARPIRLEPVMYDAGREPISIASEPGVEEPDLVKRHGDFIVILRRGFLFTVRVGDGALSPVSAVDIEDAGGPNGPCHEILVVNDLVLVIGLWTTGSATRPMIDVFRIDSAGQLIRDDSYEVAPEMGRVFVVNGRLVVVGSDLVRTPIRDPSSVFPRVQRLEHQRGGGDFAAIASARDVYRRPGVAPRAGALTVHSVSSCDVSTRPWTCRATVVLGDASQGMHLSRAAAYFWTSPARRGAAPLTPRLESANAMLFRVPLDGGPPQALGVAGSPYYFDSFMDDGTTLSIFVAGDSTGDDVWYSRKRTSEAALLQLPLSNFGDGSSSAPIGNYRWTPLDSGGMPTVRLTAQALVYAVDHTAKDGRSSSAILHVVRFKASGLQRLEVPYAVDIIAPSPGGALVAGSDGRAFHVNELDLATGTRVTRPLELDSATLGARRGRGIFEALRANERTLGIALRSGTLQGDDTLFEMPAAVLFFESRGNQFRAAGSLAVPADTIGPARFDPRCVEWFGSARPIWVDRRTLAVIGPWLVEGTESRGVIVESRRVRFDSRPPEVAPPK